MSQDKENVSIKMCNKKVLNSMQQKVQANISSENQSIIAKILSLKAFSSANVQEVFQGGAKLSLDVYYEAVACLESGEIVCLEQTVSGTSVTYESPYISQEKAVFVRPCVIDNQTTINDGEINIISLINIDVFVKDNSSCFVPPVVEDNISIKTTENKVCSQRDSFSSNGNIKGEIAVDSKFKKVVFSNYTGYLKSFDVKTDYFVINGEMYAYLLCEYEDGQLKTITKTFDFSEEIELKGIDKDDILQLYFSTMKKLETNIVVGQNGETIIELDMPYKVCGEVYSCYNQEVIIDAYDTFKEVNLTTESFENAISHSSCFAEEKIIAAFNLNEDSPRVERILGTAGENISLVNSVVKDGELILEGIANVCVIYYSEDDEGNKVLNSALIDLPYSFNILNNDLKEGDIIDVDLHLGEISIKNKKGRELEVVANVFICYNNSSPNVNAFTTEIILGEEKPTAEYPLEIVIAREGETLWDIAKRLSVKEETLMIQNPNIELPVQEGEKIVIYRERKGE